MLKLLGIIAPFVMGRFMGPQAQQGPGLIEKSVLAYRKILALTLLGLVSAFLFSSGLILGAIAIGQKIDLTGNWQWTNLALAGLWLTGFGVTGFVAALAIGKFWKPGAQTYKRTSLFGRSAPVQEKSHVSLPDVISLFIMDVIEDRRNKREVQGRYKSPGYSTRADHSTNYQNPLH